MPKPKPAVTGPRRPVRNPYRAREAGSSDPVLALDTTTSTLKAVEAVLLAATLTIGFATGWTIKFAVDSTPCSSPPSP